MGKLLLTAAAVAIAAPASAGVVYSNNFDAENGGNTALNYNGFNGLDITGGTVDLVRSGDFGIACAGGSGSCVDLDGSTGDAGLTSSTDFGFNGGDLVELDFSYSGNQRGGAADAFRAAFLFNQFTSGTYGYRISGTTLFTSAFSGTGPTGFDIFGIGATNGFTDFTIFFTADNAGTTNFFFQDAGNDNIGVILDNVSLSVTAVPEPSTWAMLILGFGVVGAAARRRRSIAGTITA